MVEEKIVEACARAAHEVNRAYCLALGDESQPPWDTAPDWQKSSARKGVAGALAGNTPEQSHASWLKEKAEMGWKYAPVKDVEKKEHPCFVPYAELPPVQQQKDHLFLSTVRAVARSLDVTAPKFVRVPSLTPVTAGDSLRKTLKRFIAPIDLKTVDRFVLVEKDWYALLDELEEVGLSIIKHLDDGRTIARGFMSYHGLASIVCEGREQS